MDNGAAIARDYHQRTSHSLTAYARGPEALDWSEQPDPFRSFEGAACLPLPLLDEKHPSPDYADLFIPGRIEPAALNLETLAALLELSLGISAWKVYGPDRWALRCNPSSGNLHPTEGYVVASGITDLADGVYHYRPDQHQLEKRSSMVFAGDPRLIIGLSSILWREGWKYGERAFRYCQLDIGHAIGAFAYAAATLGWHVHLLDHHADQDVATLLGLSDVESFSAAEAETPELLFEVGSASAHGDIPAEWFDLAAQSQWQGHANRIDSHPYGQWPILEKVAAATIKDKTTAMRQAETAIASEPLLSGAGEIQATALIRQRRSAQHFDPRVMLPLNDFFRMLDATLSRNELPPWPDNGPPVQTHLLLFVHRVQGLRQGLYALPRSENGLTLMKQEMSKQFIWQKVDAAPDTLPLYLLINADSRNAARTLFCRQQIGGDAAFGVAMLGEFDLAMQAEAASYRALFHEAGLIGQSLYLEAEYAGFRGTGIGCYFDPAVHETIGLTSTQLQSMYHFTVGTPLIDERIETFPPYAHLER